MTSDLSQMNGVTLAYIGDAVIELLIREALLSFGVKNTGRLSAIAQKLVCAPTQSQIAEELLPLFTEEEATAYRLGRNHHVTGKPKKASVAEYSRATGLEAVFGYLHLTAKTERIRILFCTAYEERLRALHEQI